MFRKNVKISKKGLDFLRAIRYNGHCCETRGIADAAKPNKRAWRNWQTR